MSQVIGFKVKFADKNMPVLNHKIVRHKDLVHVNGNPVVSLQNNPAYDFAGSTIKQCEKCKEYVYTHTTLNLPWIKKGFELVCIDCSGVKT